ncbi:MAG: hypothetical protein HQK79_02950 [Desulfobacterales bacterium]|nr:hypothetical protein [Desulfobacterales bacterium]MBF0397754.1 hypothetical protein [Desulfobacterales bacterium]
MENLNKKYRGIASLFDQEEIKVFFKNYLIFIGIIELFIFLVSFISQLGPENIPFPWKTYFFASFMVPIAITFLIGVFIVAFNRYIFPDHSKDVPNFESEIGQSKKIQGYIQKIHTIFNLLQKIPFLISLLLLALFSLTIYKLDAIMFFIGKAGEKAIHYLFIICIIVVCGGIIFLLIWMFMNYNLRKKSMEFRYKYQQEVMKELGYVFLNDNTVVDQKGNVITYDDNKPIDVTPKLLPNLDFKNQNITSSF